MITKYPLTSLTVLSTAVTIALFFGFFRPSKPKPAPPAAPRVVAAPALTAANDPAVEALTATMRGLMIEGVDTGFIIGYGAASQRATAAEVHALRVAIRSNRMDLVRNWFASRTNTTAQSAAK